MNIAESSAKTVPITTEVTVIRAVAQISGQARKV